MEEDISSWYLPQKPSHQGKKPQPLSLLLVLGVKSRTPHVPGKCSATELKPLAPGTEPLAMAVERPWEQLYTQE